MKFSEFIYKRIDLEETKKKIQEITEKLKHAQSVEEQVQAVFQKGVKVMKFSEFIYKRIDLEETKKKIQEITEKLKHAQSVEEQVQAVYEMNDVKKEIATADSLVYIRYTIKCRQSMR